MGDACTAPDVYDASCNCSSTALPDFDNDGICDDQDPDDDNDGVDDTADCAPFDASIFPGGPCDDGDACTAPDVYDASCNCTSTALPDFDNDGICDDQDPDDDNDGVDDTADCAPFDASIFPGGPCDDGDACTAPDVYDASCNCTSTALPDFDNDGICDDQDPDDDNDGVDDTADCAPFDASIFPGGPCDDGDACTAPDVYDASCNCTSTALPDFDNDGICDDQDPDDDNDGVDDTADCAPFDASIFPGGSCDDGNTGTINDVYDTSCNCTGTPCSVTNDLIITAVYDGPLTGGTPKGVELYALNNIADLSIYGIGSANNGGGTDGEEFTFPSVAATAGQFIYVASDSAQFNTFFGFAPDYTNSAVNINGDDAIELFQCGQVVDVFGDINTDGTGEPWEHLDGWAYRNCATGPDGSTFVLANWTFSGPNALDNETSNTTAATTCSNWNL